MSAFRTEAERIAHYRALSRRDALYGSTVPLSGRNNTPVVRGTLQLTRLQQARVDIELQREDAHERRLSELGVRQVATNVKVMHRLHLEREMRLGRPTFQYPAVVNLRDYRGANVTHRLAEWCAVHDPMWAHKTFDQRFDTVYELRRVARIEGV